MKSYHWSIEWFFVLLFLSINNDANSCLESFLSIFVWKMFDFGQFRYRIDRIDNKKIVYLISTGNIGHCNQSLLATE